MNEKYNLITPENIQGELIKNEIELNNLRVQAFKEQKYNELLTENKELKDRINKAIEYIDNNQLFEFKYDEEELFEYITDLKVKEELKKILKEDNKEEK